MNLAEPIDIRTGRPFADRVHPHHRETPLERASTGGRARGLLGGLFGGCLMAAQGGKTYDVQDYVGWGTSDLVAMWDGIRNVGATADHDSTATAWTNLAANHNNLTVGSNVWGANCLQCTSAMSVTSAVYSYIGTAKQFTYEAVFSTPDASYTAWKGGPLRAQYQIINTGHYEGNMTLVGYFNGNKTVPWEDSKTASVAVSFEAQTSSDYSLPVLYKDGVFVKNATAASSARTATSMGIGQGYADGGTVVLNCFRFYNRALTAAEVAANYAVDAERFGL